jgi:hypothetical protein
LFSSGGWQAGMPLHRPRTISTGVEILIVAEQQGPKKLIVD